MEASTGLVFADASADRRLDRLNQYHGIFAREGRRGAVEEFFRVDASPAAQEQKAYDRATWRMWLGDREGALAELERGFKYSPFQFIYIAVDPMFEPLRSDPRFQRVVERVGLAPSNSTAAGSKP